ncbi:MAG TPA: hypothetical protein VNA30_02145 [Mycobacteriales bacterium]|nr:hypothetical protein [Mycobacteriales bacterium]
MRRTLLLASCLAVVAAGSLAPAHAKPPKSFKRSVIFVDRTPDPIGFHVGPEHCRSYLGPMEKPVEVAIPGPGVVDVAISGFSGQWSLLIMDKDGEVLGTADADPPATEATTLRLKRAMKINILPCNNYGTFEATLTYGYTYKK